MSRSINNKIIASMTITTFSISTLTLNIPVIEKLKLYNVQYENLGNDIPPLVIDIFWKSSEAIGIIFEDEFRDEASRYDIYKNGKKIIKTSNNKYLDNNVVPGEIIEYEVYRVDSNGYRYGGSKYLVDVPYVDLEVESTDINEEAINFNESSVSNKNLQNKKGNNLIDLEKEDVAIIYNKEQEIAVSKEELDSVKPPKNIRVYWKTAKAIGILWDNPYENRDVNFIIYKNGEELIKVNGNKFLDRDVFPEDTILYEVSTEYGGHVSKSEILLVRVPEIIERICPKIHNHMEFENKSNNKVMINWDKCVSIYDDFEGGILYRNNKEIFRGRENNYIDEFVEYGKPYIYKIVFEDIYGNKSNFIEKVITLQKENFVAKNDIIEADKFDKNKDVEKIDFYINEDSFLEFMVSSPINIYAFLLYSGDIKVRWGYEYKNLVNEYRVYRDGKHVYTTTSSWYVDKNIDKKSIYVYEVEVIDSLGNVSEKARYIFNYSRLSRSNDPNNFEDFLDII